MSGGPREFCYRQRPQDEREAFREYAELCQREPRLTQLLINAMREQPTTSEFYRSFKPCLTKLAGWSAEHPELRNSHDYDVVYETVYSMVYD